ncbi:MAG: aspartate aminotransferase family protein [Gammaproteobacteria bacterium]|nr:MAG: aspartate aminotransferase family protein [Gammaproteobacteria bacterium]
MSAYGRLPVTFASGKGITLTDTDGRDYLDALGGVAVCALGHANEAVSRAIAEQASTLMHVSNWFGIAEQEALGRKLCELAGMDKVFFGNSGAEANEAAIKIARLHGHRKGIENPRILVADTAFHGRTLATISATGNTRIQNGFGPLLDGFSVIRCNDIAAIDAVAATHDDIVAVMLEPIQGEGGVLVPEPGYLEAVGERCRQHGWLLVLDEIQSGMGRTGKWFAYQHESVVPDVITVAKALGNGMPIGACLARGNAAELIQPGSHGSTFGGNPLACRVGLAVIEELDSKHLVARAGELGKRITDAIRQGLHNQSEVVEVRGKGLMIGIELASPCSEIIRKALDRGLLLNVTADRVVRLLPPYILTDAEADELARRVTDVIAAHLEESRRAAAEPAATGH